MIKRTLYFGNTAYLSMKNAQMVLRMPGKDDEEDVVRTFPIEANNHHARTNGTIDGKQLCGHYLRQHSHALGIATAS